MKVIIEFRVENDAFLTDWDGEVGRILDKARTKLFHHGRPTDEKNFEVIGRLLDSNGNSVGHVRVEEGGPE